MKTRYFALLLVFLGLFIYMSPVRAEDATPLLYWKFEEGSGSITLDSSGHGVTGDVRALWRASETGYALYFDGTSRTVVTAHLPQAVRLGKGSWSLMAWIKPHQFTIESRQNQRRLFAYGAYPKAFFCVDILGNGALSLYQVYQEEGKNLSASANSSVALTLDRWTHVAIVCDRQAQRAQIYINGILRGEQEIPANFHPDLSGNGDFTVGNGFQNYNGTANEVKLYARALNKGEVNAEFLRLKGMFRVVPTPAEAAAEGLAEAQEALSRANSAWGVHDFMAVRVALNEVLARSEVPASYRSYAHLRLAQSYVAENRLAEAQSEYARLAAKTEYPQVHRTEAEERVQELARQIKGMPARDPAATRVVVPAVKNVLQRLYVAPDGKDTNPGSQKLPLATLTAARDNIRTLRTKVGKRAVEVIVEPGVYCTTESLKLDAEDGGTADAPVIYRAQRPGTVTLCGGTRLTGFKPVRDAAILKRLPEEARGKVVQCDLKALGIRDYGALAVRGFAQPASPPTLELYVNHKPMTLARWPNTGFVRPTRLIEPGNRSLGTPSVFAYEDNRHARWVGAEDAWIFGYFHFLWADATARIGKIDPDTKTLTTAEAYAYGGRGMSDEQGIKYYAFNLLEELDIPGEWYLDRSTGILYLYPPSDISNLSQLADATVEISLLSRPMVAAKDIAHVRFEGITFDLGRGDGIVLENATDCLLAGCTVSRMAGSGIRVLGGARDTLLSCDIHTIGRRATEVIGGDRATLTPGGHLVANCRIHDFGRIDRTYTPGVQLEGVGNRVAHNLFYNCPSSALRIEGNDHLIEYNEVHHVLLESDDQGAMELFGNPTYRGVVFRYNLFYHLGSGPTDRLTNGQAAIRLDDAISGILIYGNLFYQAANGRFGSVQINSGRDNIIDNNLFAETMQGISGGYNGGNHVWQTVREGNAPRTFYTSSLYLSRYPALASMLKEPGINQVWRNLFYKVGRNISGNPAALEQISNLSTDQSPFRDAERGDFRLKQTFSAGDAAGFRPIPVEEIGIYPDIWPRTGDKGH